MKRAIPCCLTAYLFLLATHIPLAQTKRAMTPSDTLRIASVGDPQISPDGEWVVYTVSTTEGDATRTTLWIARTTDVRRGSAPLLDSSLDASHPRWSPDGKRIAFRALHDGQSGIWVVASADRQPRFVAPVRETNFFITYAGESLAWSPDSRRIAFVSVSDDESETEDRAATRDDPRVIDRIQYKSRTSFSDRARTHIWITDVDRPEPRQLTFGRYYDHAITWSPRGDEIAYLSNHEPDPDANNNSDIFAVNMDGRVRQITQTRGCEYEPAWSPDGKWIAYLATKRDVTTIDSVAEDTHVWVIDAGGGTGRELTAALDRRARSPRWSTDSRYVFFLAGDYGQTLIYRVGVDDGKTQTISVLYLGEGGSAFITSNRIMGNRPTSPLGIRRARLFQINGFSMASKISAPARGTDAVTYDSSSLVFTLADGLNPGEVWFAFGMNAPVRRVTTHNDALVRSFTLVEPEEIRYKSFDGTPIQGWLMKPVGFREGQRYPLILSVHGGPHGMYGYGFNPAFQVYAANGYAVLYLNPRGSSGYGQKFSDGTLKEWGGGDYRDLMLGVDEALRTHPWIDPNRLGVTGGSYGGFMTNWIVTQTPRFKAAVSLASVSNLISFYATSLYQDLIHAEFGGFPWDDYELLWRWSPLRYVNQAQTPLLLIHGEQDNDVHITQAEEMYMALKRRGVEAMLVRYPREGHGFREPRHRVDTLERTVAWFDRFLK